MHEARQRCIVLIGCIPPPYGGVSVHVCRLVHRLQSSGHECYVVSSCNTEQVIDGVKVIRAPSKLGVSWQCVKLTKKKPVFHFHTMWNDGLCKLILKAMRQSIVSTIHDTMVYDKFMTLNHKHRYLNKFVLKIGHEKFIAVNTDIKLMLNKMGAPLNDISVIPAYLPETRSLPEDLDPRVRGYINSHEYVILVYGWKVSYLQNGADIYGFDIAVNVYSALLENYPRIGLIVLVPGGDADGYISRLAETINIDNKYLLWTEPIKNMHNLLNSIDLYFRPTITDGDSVLVREALASGINVVASNLVNRPEGVLVANHCIGDYIDAIKLSFNKVQVNAHDECNYSRICMLYNQM